MAGLLVYVSADHTDLIGRNVQRSKVMYDCLCLIQMLELSDYNTFHLSFPPLQPKPHHEGLRVLSVLGHAHKRHRHWMPERTEHNSLLYLFRRTQSDHVPIICGGNSLVRYSKA